MSRSVWAGAFDAGCGGLSVSAAAGSRSWHGAFRRIAAALFGGERRPSSSSSLGISPSLAWSSLSRRGASGGGDARIVAHLAAASRQMTLVTMSHPAMKPRCWHGAQVGRALRSGMLTAVAIAFAAVSLSACGRVSDPACRAVRLFVSPTVCRLSARTQTPTYWAKRAVEATSSVMRANKLCARWPAWRHAL